MKTELSKNARIMLLEYLKGCMEEKGITQQQIAEKTGFTQNNISRMLSGRYSPDLDNFILLADAIGVYFFIIDKEDKGDLTKMMKNRWGKISPS